ncbi:MAG: succinylglutamate desuccinylase, partial [Idiomarina sp.]|nr:succinylglutamate desuccinylase [Idiomarina sp.]
TSPVPGIIIGCTNIPVANEGEALFNIAQFESDSLEEATDIIDSFTETYE